MNHIALGLTTACVAIAGSIALSATAAAAPLGGSSASDTISALQAQGYSVQINGQSAVPLSRCTVSGVHGLSSSHTPDQFATAYVDIVCPDSV